MNQQIAPVQQQSMQIQTQFSGFTAAVRQALEHPFPQEVIRKDVLRPSDGWSPTYVPAPEIIKRLNAAFNSCWSLRVMKWEWLTSHQPAQVLAHVELTVPVFIQDPSGSYHAITVTKEATGGAFIKIVRNSNTPADFVSDLKAAVTDGLKKAATLFGVALELYDRDESAMQGMNRQGGHEQGNFPTAQFNPNSPAAAFQIESVVKGFAQLQVPEQQWLAGLGIQNVQQLTMGLVQMVLSGQHPYVQQVMAAQGGVQQVGGLRASNA